MARTVSIMGFSGHPLSGLWQVHFSNGDLVHVESGFGVRQIVECFGSLEKAVGRKVRYRVDWLGVLEWFQPIGEEE